MALYRIWYGDDNDRGEIARAKADDMDQVIDLIKREFLKKDVEYEEEGDDDDLILILDICSDCEYRDKLDEDGERYCENCTRTEWIQIERDDDVKPEFKTIFGSNDFYDLTDPDKTRLIYNEFLNKAWEKSPRLGVAALIVQTIKDNPDLEKGFSPELIKKSKKLTADL